MLLRALAAVLPRVAGPCPNGLAFDSTLNPKRPVRAKKAFRHLRQKYSSSFHWHHRYNQAESALTADAVERAIGKVIRLPLLVPADCDDARLIERVIRNRMILNSLSNSLFRKHVMTQAEPADELPIETDVATVAALQNSGDDFLLLDVREPSEYETAKIEGSVLIPMGEILDRLDELQSHQDRLIVVHCHHGGRSMRVTEALRNRGFAKVQNMAGGIDQWSLEIDAAVPRY